MDMTSFLPPVKPQDEVSPVAPNDYKDEQGLLVCGVCGRHKQVHIVKPDLGLDFIAPCLCDCGTKARDDKKKEQEYQEHLMKLEKIRSASLMSSSYADARFETYIHRPENKQAYTIARNYVDKFQLMKEKNQGLLFYGSVGIGKSYTSACIANALMDKGTTVVMTSFVKLLQEVQRGEDTRIMNLLETVSLLIIDDLGAERNTPYALEKVYNFIDSRVRSELPMILTTNLTMEQMRDPETIEYQRIYDRIFKVCYPVHMSGSSMRMQEARDRYKNMQEIIGV